jgi:hypothetical protein
VHVVAQQVAFFIPAFLLLGQLSKYFAQMLPQLAVQHFAAAFRNENHGRVGQRRLTGFE